MCTASCCFRLKTSGPLHSFRTLLQDLGTVAYDITCTSLDPNAKIVITTRPTPIQAKVFKLLAQNYEEPILARPT